MEIVIRPATVNDALHVANAVDMAGHGIEIEFWKDERGDDLGLLDAARRTVLQDQSQPYHYTKAHILELDGIVAGCVIGSLIVDGAPPPAGLPDYVLPVFELENRLPGYWSLLVIAVYPEHRGKGLSRVLLDHAARLGAATGAKGVLLAVEDTNEAAIATYRSNGFVEDERLPWIPYGGRSGPVHWLLMVRRF